MGSPNLKSFIAGFASALIALAAFYHWQHSGMTGGMHADSPNGAYKMSVTAPLSPQSGGTYDIQIIDNQTSVVVRQTHITLPADEQTVALRGSGGSVVWDVASAFVDVQLSGEPLVRVWVP